MLETKPYMQNQSVPAKNLDLFVTKPFNEGSHAPIKGPLKPVHQVNSPSKEPIQNNDYGNVANMITSPKLPVLSNNFLNAG